MGSTLGCAKRDEILASRYKGCCGEQKGENCHISCEQIGSEMRTELCLIIELPKPLKIFAVTKFPDDVPANQKSAKAPTYGIMKRETSILRGRLTSYHRLIAQQPDAICHVNERVPLWTL